MASLPLAAPTAAFLTPTMPIASRANAPSPVSLGRGRSLSSVRRACGCCAGSEGAAGECCCRCGGTPRPLGCGWAVPFCRGAAPPRRPLRPAVWTVSAKSTSSSAGGACIELTVPGISSLLFIGCWPCDDALGPAVWDATPAIRSPPGPDSACGFDDARPAMRRPRGPVGGTFL